MLRAGDQAGYALRTAITDAIYVHGGLFATVVDVLGAQGLEANEQLEARAREAMAHAFSPGRSLLGTARSRTGHANVVAQ